MEDLHFQSVNLRDCYQELKCYSGLDRKSFTSEFEVLSELVKKYDCEIYGEMLIKGRYVIFCPELFSK